MCFSPRELFYVIDFGSLIELISTCYLDVPLVFRNVENKQDLNWKELLMYHGLEKSSNNLINPVTFP